jgi:ATP/maltotriose-dependent transcriptional regulator MalT/DNA-binding SARP family transcriptional activator
LSLPRYFRLGLDVTGSIVKKPPALAKLSRPRVHQAVARERLFSMLDRAAEYPLLWVVGPPGAGKTTLVATYLESRGLRAVWYQIDAGDADPATFFYYLVQAVGVGRRKQRPLPLLTPEHLSDLPAFTRRFFRQLFSHLTEGAIVVFDNFQEASDAGLAPILRDACTEVPQGTRIVVISRAEPAAAFAELGARQALTVIAWNDLRLTLEETRAMSRLKDVGEDWLVRALHEQSDGWAAGVTLMLERLKRVGAGSGTLLTDTRESVFNYFASLIFDQASEATRQTLLGLAFVPQITPALAHALSGNADAGKLLDQLYRRHLFTDRRAGAEPVYQFHALFQDFLRARAGECFAPEELRARVHRAGLLLVDHGQWEAAFALLVQAQAWTDAVPLVLAHASQLLSTGRWQTLSQWIDAIPRELSAGEPWLQYWLATAQEQTEPALAIATFERAQRLFDEGHDRLGRVLSLAGLMRACSVDHLDYRAMDCWLDELAVELESPPSFASVEQELEAWGALLWAAFFLRPWHTCIRPSLERVDALLAQNVDATLALGPASSALTVANQTSDQDRAERLARRVEFLAEQEGVSPVTAAWALFQVAHRQCMIADYEGSLACFDRVWALAERNGLKEVLSMGLMHRFMVEFRICDLATAEATLRKIEALPSPRHPLSQALLNCYQARYALLRGQRQTAADLAERTHAAVLRSGAVFYETAFGLIDADILLGAGRLEKVRTLVARSREVIERSEILATFRASLALVEAWIAEQEGRDSDSMRLLRDALIFARIGYGWCHLRFADATMAHLFPIALERGLETEQVTRLIRKFRLKPPEPDIDAWPWPLRVKTLGQFEVLANDAPLQFERKTPKKALWLLKVLVAFGPGEVPEQQVLDALWPDEEGDAASKALSVTVLRLRRVLGDNDLIRQQGGKLTLDRQQCWVDAWAFEQRLAQSSMNGGAGGERLPPLRRALALYRGAFLPEDTGEAWTVPLRERLRAKFIHALGSLGKHLEADSRHEEAIPWYLKGLDADPIVEHFYQGLMRCYERLDRRTEAVTAYRRLKHTLSLSLGLRPSASTEKLYQSLRSG